MYELPPIVKLAERLRLSLKDGARLCPLGAGIDFLGYVIHPTHTLVRRRVIGHAWEKLSDWERRYVRGRRVLPVPTKIAELQSIWASYLGHFSHANSRRLRQQFLHRFDWLHTALGEP